MKKDKIKPISYNAVKKNSTLGSFFKKKEDIKDNTNE
jgi:hypothetical protein